MGQPPARYDRSFVPFTKPHLRFIEKIPILCRLKNPLMKSQGNSIPSPLNPMKSHWIIIKSAKMLWNPQWNHPWFFNSFSARLQPQQAASHRRQLLRSVRRLRSEGRSAGRPSVRRLRRYKGGAIPVMWNDVNVGEHKPVRKYRYKDILYIYHKP